MIDILFVADRVKLPNGITMVMKNFIDHNDSTDIHFSLVALPESQEEVLDYFRSKGVEVYKMPNLSLTGIGPFIDFFKGFFAEHKFDIVHSHFSQIENIVFRIAKKSGVKACVSHSHSSKLSESALRAIRNKLMCWGLINVADYCAACSEQAGIALYGKKFTNSPKRLIIKNGIECQRFQYNDAIRTSIRNEYNISSECVLIGHIGRFTPVKNHRLMVDILAELLMKGNFYKMMFVGEGNTRQEIEEYAKQKGVYENIIFTGYKLDTHRYLNAFDVFLMPSLHEGLGLAAVEAQANGLSCVLSSTIPTDVDLTGVSFVKLEEPVNVWAEKVARMSGIHNPNYNQKVKDAGYDINDVCHNLFDFYKRIIQD